MASGIHLGTLVESAYERRGGEVTLVYEGRRIPATERLDAVRRLTGGLVGLGVGPVTGSSSAWPTARRSRSRTGRSGGPGPWSRRWCSC